MKNYKHIQHVINPPELIQGLIQEWRTVHQDAFYDISTLREKMSPALSKTRAYHLRVPVIAREKIVRTESTQNVIECADTNLLKTFPVMSSFIEEVGKQLFGGWTTLGRIFVTRLDASEKIGRHIDEGHYFNTLHRFHIPLESNGASFCWDDDSIGLKVGELWRLNNSIPHWVENGSGMRTHLIFDGA
jgi:hypothetical protein